MYVCLLHVLSTASLLTTSLLQVLINNTFTSNTFNAIVNNIFITYTSLLCVCVLSCNDSMAIQRTGILPYWIQDFQLCSLCLPTRPCSQPPPSPFPAPSRPSQPLPSPLPAPSQLSHLSQLSQPFQPSQPLPALPALPALPFLMENKTFSLQECLLHSHHSPERRKLTPVILR